MNNLNVPKSVTLNKNKKSIEVKYADDKYLLLSSSYLRAYSPSAENKRNLKEPNHKFFSNVLVEKIEAVGNYAIRIKFDDGHNTGIYSWDYLYEIGIKFQNSLIP